MFKLPDFDSWHVVPEDTAIPPNTPFALVVGDKFSYWSKGLTWSAGGIGGYHLTERKFWVDPVTDEVNKSPRILMSESSPRNDIEVYWNTHAHHWVVLALTTYTYSSLSEMMTVWEKRKLGFLHEKES